MRNYWQNKFRPVLKKVRDSILGDDWKYQIKPIAWYNLHQWVKFTIEEDRRFYSHKPRSFSSLRWQGIISPNLKQPIFIVGAPRSGTTFLGSCLAELPELSYHFEPVLTKAAVRYVYTMQWSPRKAARFYRAVYRWLMRIQGDGDLIFAEKTPRNCFIIPFLYATFPDAKFIHIVRDGRDAAISLAKRPWYRKDMNGSGAKDPGGYPFGSMARFWVDDDRSQEFENTNDIHRCAWLWQEYVANALEGAKVLPSDQYHELRYENLVTKSGEECDRLLDFLSITNQESRGVLHKAVTSKAQPNSIGGWERELSSEQQEQIRQEAGTLLDKLGYFFLKS